MKILITLVAVALIGALGAYGYVYSGAFDIAADQPHSKWVYAMAETTREHSIAARIKDIEVPDLEDPKKVAAGASEYAEMCTGCHLAPGMEDNELRPGLYPAAPNLAEHVHGSRHSDANTAAARQFWIIKHGIKMSAMPAWGKTHDDATIWTMVAFLQRLPELSPQAYVAMTAGSESAHEMSGHGSMSDKEKGGDQDAKSMRDMPGMAMPKADGTAEKPHGH